MIILDTLQTVRAVAQHVFRYTILRPRGTICAPAYGRILTAFPGDLWGVYSVALSPDNRLLATGGYFAVRVYDLQTQALVRRLPAAAHTNCVVMFSPDGRFMASSTSSYRTRVWDTARWRLDWEAPAAIIAFAPDGNQFAALGEEGLAVWSMADRSAIASLPLEPMPLYSAAFSPDGMLLVAGCDDGVVVWDVAARRQDVVLKGVPRYAAWNKTWHSAPASAVAFSGDGRLLAGGMKDGHIQIWETGVWDEPRTLERDGRHNITAIAFTPDARCVLEVGLGTIRVWRTDTWELDHVLRFELDGDPFRITGVALSLDGKLLAMCNWAGPQVCVWQAPDSLCL